MRVLALLLVLAAPARAQLAVGFDVSAGPSLTSVGASGTVEAAGLPIPLGHVDIPAAVGVDARVRLAVWGGPWGGRLGVGYLGASDVFDGASVFQQRGVDLGFALASGELVYRHPVAFGALGSGEVVAGLGPEVRVVLDEGTATDGLLALLGDVRQSHLAVGASLGARFRAGGLWLGPELRGGLALTPFSDDTVDAFGGALRLAGDFRLHHVSLSLTLGVE
ncbi:hypothetical protein [Rubrivirga sp. IMCC45206]|uniref:hypothetical protein n=1 Tax=Rubrivirga sp. IMCC45206 TaxID=3391614 RepID=UPI0039901B4B